jgi:preprotein translocase subunit SecD
VLFVVGAALARPSDPRTLTAGVIGLALSLVAAPLWYFVAFGAVSVFKLG